MSRASLMTRLISDWLVGINVSKFLEPRGLRASSGGVSLRLSELWLHPSTIVFHVGSVHSVTVLHHPNPTHEHGHTLDLVLSCGLSVLNMRSVVTWLWTINLYCLKGAVAKPQAPAWHCWTLNLLTDGQFYAAFPWYQLTSATSPLTHMSSGPGLTPRTKTSQTLRLH